MGVVKDVVTLGGVAAIAGFGAYWFLRNRGDGGGEGWSIFGGGYAGGTEKTGGAESGPLGEDGGDGGHGKEQTEGGTNKGKGGSDGKSGDGEKPSDGPKGSGGSGGKGGKSKEGSGGDGKGGGGIGGGSGGGVGHGEGAGSSGGVDEVGGDGETEEGGGDGQEMKPLNGWGEMIEGDLPKPDISPAMLEKVGNTIYTLVGNSVLSTTLPGPLKEFNPEVGLDIEYWADVALHTNYALPQGRLDPENKTHIPWINLWIDILGLVVRAENELNGDGEEVA